jgi:hypothetical protein
MSDRTAERTRTAPKLPPVTAGQRAEAWRGLRPGHVALAFLLGAPSGSRSRVAMQDLTPAQGVTR